MSSSESGSARANPTPPSAAGAAGPSSADATKQAQAAIAAIDKAATAVSQARDATDKAGKYEKAIQDITGSTAKSTQSALDNLQTLQATIEAINQNKVLNALTTAQDDLDKSKTGKPEFAVNDACSKLKQPAGGDQQDVTDAQAKCATAEKDADSTLAAATKALTGLQTALQSISPYLANQFDALDGTLKSFTDAKLISASGATDAAAAKQAAGGGAAKKTNDTAPAKQTTGTTPATGTTDASTATPSATPSPGPSPTVLLQVLPKGLPALQQVLVSIGEYKTAWDAMKPTVESTSAGKTPAPSAAGASSATSDKDKKDVSPAKNAAPDADAELKKLQDDIDAIKTNLAAWFAAISGQLQADSQKLDAEISGVTSDPAKNSAAALGDVRDETNTLAAVQSVVDAWPPLVGFLVDGQPSGFSLGTTRKNYEQLQTWTNTLRASISRVHDALAGDFTDFETDQVSLYYFSDIPRLMYALNERFQTMGGVAEAKAQADAQRTALTQTELDLADAQATVNRYQKQVLDLQEQQRQANEKLKGLNSNLSKLASRLKQAQDAKQAADDAVTKATQNEQASTTSTNTETGEKTTVPADPTLAAAVTQAKAKQTADAAKLSTAQSNYDAAKTDRDNAQSQADDTQNQKDSLPAKLAAAQQSLSDAQASVSEERRKMLLAVQAESDAFAYARDNAPFLFAPADASSPDPAKRVILYAFNDSKTIFMRGKRSDVDEVKRIIAAFDQPAPQARLTLWTFELSAEASQKANKGAARKLNTSMEIIDQELSDTRALENTTLTLLRDIVNEQVRGKSGLPSPPPNCDACTPADWEKLSHLKFYDPLVLSQLNFNREKVENQQLDVKRLRGEIPDPAGTTTLGETLLIVSLAPVATRMEVRQQLELRLRNRLSALPLSPKLDTCAWSERAPEHLCRNGVIRPKKDSANGNTQYLLPLTWHALGIWEEGSPPGLTSSQLEIARALRTAYENSGLPQIAAKLAGWYRELPGLTTRLDQGRLDIAGLQDKAGQGLQPSAQDRLRQLLLQQTDPLEANTERTNLVLQGLPDADRITYRQKSKELSILKARQKTIEIESVDVLNDLRTRGFDVGDLVSRMAALPDSSDNTAEISRLMATLNPVLSSASPREAAADEMLKEMIIAIEDDLDRLFIQPMIRGLRTRLIADAGVNVGILQRESMLATNRGKARVDPRASAQLAVGEEEDILTGVQQLAQLYGAVQSGGALAALGALQQQPQEQQPEIYALTTGNKFEVTPVFDPSGQALRFKFDFVSTSNLQEPNGTTNPQFPRIERHTVDTEVQLSNLETREISRFESDSRLGLPTRYSGGVPVLKDIPYVRPWVPLIGWFVRKAGSNAVAQQSVIFGQTTIYPSIQSMVSLLEDSGSSPGGAASPDLATQLAAQPQSPPAAQTPQPAVASPQKPANKERK
jgi:hypothetical protein